MPRRLTRPPTNQPRTVESIEVAGETLIANCHSVSISDTLSLLVFVDSAEGDEITASIAGSTYRIPFHYTLLPMLGERLRVLDLGAHIGTFSMFAASLGHRVVSVEASPRNAALLTRSAAANQLAELHVVNAAISDRDGTVAFAQNGPYGMVSAGSTGPSCVTVPAITVDRLTADTGWDTVDFVKMDIEGSEPAAVRGMSRLLARDDAPVVLFESNGFTLSLFGETHSDLMKQLEDSGFVCYRVERGRLRPVRPADLQLECVVDHLAVKQLPSRLEEQMQVAPPLTFDDHVDAAVRLSTHPNAHYRAHLARELARASSDLLAHEPIVEVLGTLRDDADDGVRDAALWCSASGQS